LQPDGKIVISGSFNQVDGQPVFDIARLNPDGTADTSFNTGSGLNFPAQGILFQPDGKIVISGDFTSVNGTAMNRFARLNSDGSLDTTFAPVMVGSFMRTLLWQPNGKIIAGGSFSASATGGNRTNLARFNGDLFVTWADGDTADKTINLPIVDDLLDEPDEALGLSLTVAGGASSGPIPNATLTILDNDAPPAFTSVIRSTR
jgi:uncharacterized delta-60 repeat protein